MEKMVALQDGGLREGVTLVTQPNLTVAPGENFFMSTVGVLHCMFPTQTHA